MSRELDEQCAQALGYACVCAEAPIDCPIHNHADPYTALRYSSDSAAARLLENEIERRGLQDQYVMHLGRAPAHSYRLLNIMVLDFLTYAQYTLQKTLGRSREIRDGW